MSATKTSPEEDRKEPISKACSAEVLLGVIKAFSHHNAAWRSDEGSFDDVQERVTKFVLKLPSEQALALLQMPKFPISPLVDIMGLFMKTQHQDVCSWLIAHQWSELNADSMIEWLQDADTDVDRIRLSKWKLSALLKGMYEAACADQE